MLVVKDCRARAVVPGAAGIALVHAEVEVVGVLLTLARGATEVGGGVAAEAGDIDERVRVVQPKRKKSEIG